MFFIRIGNILAHLIFWLSLFRIGMGLFVAIGTPDVANNVAASNYLLGAANSGEAINEGMIGLLGAVVLGILAEIGAHLVRPSVVTDEENG